MSIILKRVSKSFADRLVLRQVSWELAPGITLLLGSNGAGKTTLLRLMAGLLQPDSGEITWAEDTTIGYLGHGISVYSRLTALENLRFWGKLYGCAWNEPNLMAVLQRVGLQAWAKEPAGSFSRGMSQRLNLARVLLLQPTLWLLDEPGTGLDLASQEILRAEVLEAKAAGTRVVWISHSESEQDVADQVLTLHQGTLG